MDILNYYNCKLLFINNNLSIFIIIYNTLYLILDFIKHLTYIFVKPFNILLVYSHFNKQKLLVQILNWVHRHLQKHYPLNNY